MGIEFDLVLRSWCCFGFVRFGSSSWSRSRLVFFHWKDTCCLSTRESFCMYIYPLRCRHHLALLASYHHHSSSSSSSCESLCCCCYCCFVLFCFVLLCVIVVLCCVVLYCALSVVYCVFAVRVVKSIGIRVGRVG